MDKSNITPQNSSQRRSYEKPVLEQHSQWSVVTGKPSNSGAGDDQ